MAYQGSTSQQPPPIPGSASRIPKEEQSALATIDESTITTRLRGWGGHSVMAAERRSADLERASEGMVLSRGLGRSYGDASLPPVDHPLALNTTLADRVLRFDRETGVFRAEAGFPLSQLNQVFRPQGWFTPVTPGTQYVTLGGMVASDVHGKNQHQDGNFGHHVTALKMRVADGRVLECSPDRHPDLFFATIGGMGLTGHILEVEFTMRRIPSSWIWQQSRRIANIDDFEDALEAAAPDWPATMGWIDCLKGGSGMGRGVMMCGRWAEADEAPEKPPGNRARPAMPFNWPTWVLNRFTIRAFNELYYRKQFKPISSGFVYPDSFYYPLDAIRSWNRMYGQAGFTQYQCVLPREAGRGASRRVLEVLTSRGGASFLCVIKDFGQDGVGVLSFPRPGITLALDIPVRADTQSLIDALNEQVIAEGGRIYMAKDSFTRPEHFAAMEPRLAEFEEIRNRWDPTRKFRSALSVRLLGDS